MSHDPRPHEARIPEAAAVEITDTRIKVMNDGSSGRDRLRAFVSITIDDCFVVRDLKVIESDKGFFISMPSKRLQDRCPRCEAKNPLVSRYCGHCGRELGGGRAVRDEDGKAKLFADVAHPITQGCRALIHDAVIESYLSELDASRRPGYVCRYADPGDGGGGRPAEPAWVERVREVG
jgi:stage V sporulation protein G